MSDLAANDTSSMIRLERASVGINVVAGIALAILIALVADVRGSIRDISGRVETAIRDVAVLQSQTLDARMRSLEQRCATFEARVAAGIGGKNP